MAKSAEMEDVYLETYAISIEVWQKMEANTSVFDSESF